MVVVRIPQLWLTEQTQVKIAILYFFYSLIFFETVHER